MKTKRALFSTTVLAATTAAVTLSLSARPAAACGTEAYTGQMCIMAGSYCPYNTAEPTGQILQIRQYQALFSLIGCQYGGDCRDTMALPDMRGRAPIGYGTGPGLTPRAWSGKYGQEYVTQTIAMMAPHTHGATFVPSGSGGSGTAAEVKVSTDPGDTNSPAGGKYLSAASSSGVKIYNSGTNASALTPLNGVSGGGGGGPSGGTVVIAPTGGISNGTVTPIPTVPPSIAMRYCIVLDGIYPSRP